MCSLFRQNQEDHNIIENIQIFLTDGWWFSDSWTFVINKVLVSGGQIIFTTIVIEKLKKMIEMISVQFMSATIFQRLMHFTANNMCYYTGYNTPFIIATGEFESSNHG